MECSRAGAAHAGAGKIGLLAAAQHALLLALVTPVKTGVALLGLLALPYTLNARFT
jgi:hypothetical protein